ncbi:hypothetical protein FIBSPDRAFT_898660 [Athelia psychrophila]|uniref:Uncharacterized protein n=1 Tax=Athelia psychrophila TaxID=1759441 RepID=A0A166AQJ4_9AGAM|nr:hypothetical protein FIBSPDRAFT_898660 [Fibularhizoctonia sp. CBS 109695]
MYTKLCQDFYISLSLHTQPRRCSTPGQLQCIIKLLWWANVERCGIPACPRSKFQARPTGSTYLVPGGKSPATPAVACPGYVATNAQSPQPAHAEHDRIRNYRGRAYTTHGPAAPPPPPNDTPAPRPQSQDLDNHRAISIRANAADLRADSQGGRSALTAMFEADGHLHKNGGSCDVGDTTQWQAPGHSVANCAIGHRESETEIAWGLQVGERRGGAATCQALTCDGAEIEPESKIWDEEWGCLVGCARAGAGVGVGAGWSNLGCAATSGMQISRDRFRQRRVCEEEDGSGSGGGGGGWGPGKSRNERDSEIDIDIITNSSREPRDVASQEEDGQGEAFVGRPLQIISDTPLALGPLEACA